MLLRIVRGSGIIPIMEKGMSGYPLSDRLCDRYYNQSVNERMLALRGIERGDLEPTVLKSLRGGIGECRTCGGCLAVIPGVAVERPKECGQERPPDQPRIPLQTKQHDN